MKFSRLRSCAFIVIFLACLVLPEAGGAGERHFLWRATAGDATVYLLGSVHFMKKEAYPLDRVIEEAFDRCHTLAVEADISNIGAGTIKALRRAGFYEANDSLENHVSGRTYSYVTLEAVRLGLPVIAVNRQKPWFLGLTMMSLELMRTGYNPDYGIDKHFLSRAAGQKKIVELESIEYQIGLLAGLPDDEQESFLLYTVEDLKSMGQQVDAMVSAWGTGDADRMASILTRSVEDDASLKRVYNKIMTDRNRTMAAKILMHLRSGGGVFVVVGAGHMVGEEGIVELLRAKGYHVDQL